MGSGGSAISTELIVASIGAVAAVLTLLVTGWIAYMTYPIWRQARTKNMRVFEWQVLHPPQTRQALVAYKVEYHPSAKGTRVAEAECRLWFGGVKLPWLHHVVLGREIPLTATDATNQQINAEQFIISNQIHSYRWESPPIEVKDDPRVWTKVVVKLTDDSEHRTMFHRPKLSECLETGK